MKRAAIAVGLCLFLASNVYAQDREGQDEAVVLVQVSFDRGRWTAKPLEILPCGAPSKPDALTRQRSVFQVTDRGGKVLFRRYITNPRIILVEDPEEPADLLSQMEFTLAVPFVEGASSFQFFERERDYRDYEAIEGDTSRTAEADLSEVIASYESRGHQERASCQIIAPKPEDPRQLGEVVNTALSVESITSLIARDQHLLIAHGLRLELDPKEVRQLVYSYRDNWAQVGVNEEQVERFLRRYSAAFQEALRKQ